MEHLLGRTAASDAISELGWRFLLGTLRTSIPVGSHDEAQHRVLAARDAGGRLLSADRAPAFWVLADAEGNEACVTTWQGRGD